MNTTYEASPMGRLHRKLEAEPERVFLKEELIRDLDFTGTRHLDHVASQLRRALVHDSMHRYVINVWGVGYRFRDIA